MVYSREVEGRVLTFGVSGLLYKSNVLMYDRRTESLWSQAKREAVAGPMTGAELKVLPSTITTWQKWKSLHPDTQVLSTETGYDRDYSRDPYAQYYESRKGFFSFLRRGPSEEEKRLVAGVEAGGAARAYPLDVLREKGTVKDTLGGREITLEFDREAETLTVKDEEGRELPYVTLYWFVWKGVHPEAELYEP